MNKIQGLNKEFSKQDVERMRNIISGNDGGRTGAGVGYTKEEIDRVEGDVWNEDGRKWTIKNGIKQNITKMDAAKKAVIMPIFCPKCGSKTNSFDKAFYEVHKTCFNCVIEFEHQLKIAGKYEDYVKRIHNSDIDGLIEDYTHFVNEQLELASQSYVTEQGDVEKWDGGYDLERVMEGLEKTIEHLKSFKK